MRTCDIWLTAGLVGVLAAGCGGGSEQEVVVYTALDPAFSEPILNRFEAETGIRVRAKYDTEKTKTVGLVEAIRAERSRPRCDVFWNNEIIHTLRLKRQGLLQPFACPAAKGFPAAFRDPEGYWYGFAARARVLIVNNQRVPPGQEPRRLADLADPKWKGRVSIAKPLFGTTATHVAALWAHWGPERTRAFLHRLKANGVRVEAGNKQVALRVSAGLADCGLTDTDDAIIEKERGRPVRLVYLDIGPGGMGTLFIPNTLSIVAGCPHPEAARRLVAYLLSPEVEATLARGRSAQIPLNPEVEAPVRVKTPAQIPAMPVDFDQAAKAWEAAVGFVRDEFTR